jgi:hypothetical protein
VLSAYPVFYHNHVVFHTFQATGQVVGSSQNSTMKGVDILLIREKFTPGDISVSRGKDETY